MPQFYVYSKSANEQKVLQLNLKNVNEYLGLLFGGKNKKNGNKKPNRPKRLPSKTACKIEQNDKANDLDNVIKAKESLIVRGFEPPFDFNVIIQEIENLEKSSNYKLQEVKKPNGVKEG